jgi:hypothetical protein
MCATVLYDSLVNSKLHDGKVRTVEKEGKIAPNGLGIECRASGNPRIVVNADKTFSLVSDKGNGRFYIYCLNYNATLELEAAWMTGDGDCSLKLRSRHNEKPKPSDPQSLSECSGKAFGGYGLAIDRGKYDAKREPEHNFHDQSKGGSLPSAIKNGEFFKIKFRVKDVGTSVKQEGELNGKSFMSKTDTSPQPFMVDKALYAKQSYLWVRQNLDAGTGELRIKRLKVLAV